MADTMPLQEFQAVQTACEQFRKENTRLRSALERIRNGLHAHNRPDIPLPNERRIALRDIADLALEL